MKNNIAYIVIGILFVVLSVVLLPHLFAAEPVPCRCLPGYLACNGCMPFCPISPVQGPSPECGGSIPCSIGDCGVGTCHGQMIGCPNGDSPCINDIISCSGSEGCGLYWCANGTCGDACSNSINSLPCTGDGVPNECDSDDICCSIATCRCCDDCNKADAQCADPDVVALCRFLRICSQNAYSSACSGSVCCGTECGLGSLMGYVTGCN